MRKYWLTFLLLWMGGILDYLMQAGVFGWWAPFNVTPTANHWVWFLDWIPHDTWHIIEMLRNLFYLIGAGYGGAALSETFSRARACTILIGLYILSRGLSSSILMHFK